MRHIIAFDPSKHTGWALRDIARDDSAIRCGVFELPKGADHYYTMDQISLKARALVEAEIKAKRKPNFGIVEEAALARIGGSQADSMIYAWISATAVCNILVNFGIPYATLPAVTWRSIFFPKGFKPRQKITQLKKPDENGRTEKRENLWKEACVEECERRGIILPGLKTTDHNAAEACALALCAQSDRTKIHAGRYKEAWEAVRDTKFKQDTTDNLFGDAA